MCWTNFLKPQFLGSWRIRTQITILYIIESILILALFCGMLVVQIEQSKQILMSALQNGTMTQTKSSTTTVMNRYYEISEIMLNRGIYHLLTLNRLFQFSQNLQYEWIEQPLPSLLESSNQILFDNTFCYGIFGQNTTESELLNYTALLTQSLFMLDGNDGTFASYFAAVDDSQYFTLQPSFPFTRTFIPHSRPWYTNHIDMIKTRKQTSTYYTKPYLFYGSSDFQMSQTTNLTFLNNSLAGVLATNINKGQFTFMLQAIIPQTLWIIDNAGEIVVSQRDFSSMTYLFNESSTGFNYLDYHQILNEASNQPYVDNCDYLETENILCRYNSLSDQQQFIIAKPLGTANMTLVIAIDAMNDFTIINDAYNSFSISFDQQLTLMLLILIAIILLAIITNIFIIKLILQPLDNIAKYTKQEFLFNYRQAAREIQQQQQNNNCLQEITLSFQWLMISKSDSNRLREQRDQIEQIPHRVVRRAPFKYQSFQLILKQSIQLFNQVHDLMDNEDFRSNCFYQLEVIVPRPSEELLLY